MTIMKVTAEVFRGRFMEPDLHCTVEYIVDTDNRDAAQTYVMNNLNKGGWYIKSINIQPTWLHSIPSS